MQLLTQFHIGQCECDFKCITYSTIVEYLCKYFLCSLITELMNNLSAEDKDLLHRREFYKRGEILRKISERRAAPQITAMPSIQPDDLPEKGELGIKAWKYPPCCGLIFSASHNMNTKYQYYIFCHIKPVALAYYSTTCLHSVSPLNESI